MKKLRFFRKKDSAASDEPKKQKKFKPPKKKKENPTREIRFSRTKVTKYVSLLIFLLIGLSVFFNVVFFSKYQNISNSVSAGEERIDSKLTEVDQTDWEVSEAVVPFAEDFLRGYYNVPRDKEEREERQQKLSNYFVNGFDVSKLEVLEDFDGERKLKSLRFVETDYSDRQNMNVHFYATYEVTEVVEKEVTNGKGKKKKTKTVKEENTTSDSVEIVIPVITDGEGFAVKDNPSLIHRDLTADISVESKGLEGEDVSSTDKAQLEGFLAEFFTSYGVSDEKLPFMASVENGLNGKIFDSLALRDSIQLENGDYQVIADVVYQNEETSFNSMFTYYLTISREKNNYFIENIQQGGF